MEHSSISQNIQGISNKAQVMGSLLSALQGRVAQQNNSQELQRDISSLSLLWAELEGCLGELSQEFEYVQDLSRKNNVPELLWVLGR